MKKMNLIYAIFFVYILMSPFIVNRMDTGSASSPCNSLSSEECYHQLFIELKEKPTYQELVEDNNDKIWGSSEERKTEIKTLLKINENSAQNFEKEIQTFSKRLESVKFLKGVEKLNKILRNVAVFMLILYILVFIARKAFGF